MNSLYLKKWDAFIRYFDSKADGQTIVYLPAISFSVMGSFFGVVTHPNMPSHRAIMVDYLGSGCSDHPDNFDYSIESHADSVSSILDEVGCRDATILGHSMGGTVAIQLALSRPDLVGKLIVGEGNVTSGGGGLTAQIVEHSEEDFVNREYSQMLADLLEKAKGGDTIGLRRSNVWKYASPIGLHRNAHALVDVDDSLIDQFCALSIPRTFVYGEKSVPSNAGEAGADAPFPEKFHAHGVSTEIVPNAGHGLMFDNLGGFVDILSKIAF